MNSFKEDRHGVEDFLSQLTRLLNDEEFNIDTQLNFYNRAKNVMTLTSLNYSYSDVVNCLLQLQLKHYSETVYDLVGVELPPYLRVFGYYIKRQLIYIKIKITEDDRKVVCVSFHKAEEPMIFPYA